MTVVPQQLDSWWADVRPTTMPAFLERFTLHDSTVLAMIVGCRQSLLAIQLDTHWNRAVPIEHERLWVRFERRYTEWSTCGSVDLLCVDNATSTELTEADREQLLEVLSGLAPEAYSGRDNGVPHPAFDESLTRTRLEMIGGHIEILHGATVRIVVMNNDGDRIDVSALDG